MSEGLWVYVIICLMKQFLEWLLLLCYCSGTIQIVTLFSRARLLPLLMCVGGRERVGALKFVSGLFMTSLLVIYK